MPGKQVSLFTILKENDRDQPGCVVMNEVGVYKAKFGWSIRASRCRGAFPIFDLEQPLTATQRRAL